MDREVTPGLEDTTECRWWKRSFGIDPRSLAAFRIGLAVLLLVDLTRRGQDLIVWHCDGGVLPRLAWISLCQGAGYESAWSIHALSGLPEIQLLLMLTAAWIAVKLLVGSQTKSAAFWSWILLLSIQRRNPLVLDGGDVALRCLSFWSLFLPLGSTWSIDAGAQHVASRRIVSPASAAILVQVALVYLVSAAHKSHPRWTSEFTAVYYALNLDCFVQPLGTKLLGFPVGLKILTASTYGLEVFGPFLALAPFRSPWPRITLIGAFWCFHAGLAVTLVLGLFPVVMMVGWLLFVPGVMWDAVFRKADAWHPLTGSVRGFARCFPRSHSRPKPFGLLGQATVCVLLCYVVGWNLRELDPPRWMTRFPPGWNIVGRVTGLDQRWDMFAPCPMVDDGWFILKGELQDGTLVNLWDANSPLPITKPGDVLATYGNNSRWQKYLRNLYLARYAKHRRYFASWLVQRWNRDHAGEQDSRRVKHVEIIFMRELTPAPGVHARPSEPIPLWRWTVPGDVRPAGLPGERTGLQGRSSRDSR